MKTDRTTKATPSSTRRQALRDADSSNSAAVYRIVETIPVESYFDMTNRLLMEFEASLDQRNLDAAYLYGIRFASFSLEALPKHKDYKKAKELRKINAKQVEQVLVALEDVTTRMDAEEVAAERRAAKEAAEQLEAQRIQKEKERESMKEARQESIEKSAMSKLMALQYSSRDIPTTTGTAAVPQQQLNTATPSTNSTNNTNSTKQTSSKLTKSFISAIDSLPSVQIRDVPSNETPTSSQSIMSDGLCPDEERTIRLLQSTIQHQESRLPALETTADRLRAEAKEFLHQSKRKAAVGRMAQRQRVLKSLKACKNSIFTMETQIMRIEAAASDRDVSMAMRKASEMMTALQSGIGHNNTTNVLSTVEDDLSELEQVNHVLANTDLLDGYDEDDLLSELCDDNDDKLVRNSDTRLQDTSGLLLSMPSIPISPVARPTTTKGGKPTPPIMATIA